jgi:crotonobetainyl-CoA:carnitine CoA-transferase CaiB-like acyl-CoA transferase
MMENKGQDGIPHRANPIIVDMSTALYCFQAVSAALYAKRDESKGRFIDASLMAAAANLQIVRMMAVYLEKGEMKAPSSPSGTFPTADGFIQIVVLRDRDYITLCNCLDLPDLGADPRFQTRDDRVTHAVYLNRTVSEALAKRTTAEWTAILTEAKLQNEAVLDYMQFLKHPHIQAIDLVSWLNHSGFPEPIPVPNPPGTVPLADGMPTAHAPHLGEHTAAVLGELGYDEAAVEAMRAAKAVMG